MQPKRKPWLLPSLSRFGVYLDKSQETWVNSAYYPLLGGCHVFSSTINQLPTQEGEKVRISTVVRVNN